MTRLRHGAGFWLVAPAFFIVMAYSTVPTPLYSLYQERDGFATLMITVIFAAYAVGVMTSLYLAGHVSDWLGRRPVILVAIALEILSAVLFLVWPHEAGLIVARFICGAGVGIITATATAHLAELRAVARPEEDPSRAAMVATVVNIGGLAVGPLVAGFFAQYVPGPLIVPYAVFLVLLVLASIAVLFVPETVEPSGQRRPYRPQRISLPAHARSLFFAAAVAAAAGFAVFGLFTSLAPTFLEGTLHETSLLLAGVVVFGVFAAAAVVQVALARVARRTQLWIGVASMCAGLVAIGAGVLTDSLPSFAFGGLVAGAGAGLAFRASIAVAASLASPTTRGEVLAAIFLVAYAGLAVPVLAIGAGLAFFPEPPVLAVFAAAILVLVLWSGALMLRRRET